MSPQPTDPFAALGLPRRFGLERAEIDRAYFTRVGDAHPDAALTDEADDRASALNEAREVLLSPERRANALLELLGGPDASGDRSLPPAFLTEMMTTRLEIEEAVESGDPQALDHWRRWADGQQRSKIDTVAGIFAGLESVDQPDPSQLAEIRLHLNVWRYIERLIEQLPSKRSAAGGGAG